jgi:hypothetical protein
LTTSLSLVAAVEDNLITPAAVVLAASGHPLAHQVVEVPLKRQ